MADTSNTLPAIEILLFNQHKYAEAEKELRNFLAVNPDNAYGHSLLALALLNLDRNDESLKEAQNSVHLNPNNPYCYYILSIVQLNSCDDLSAAESSIKNALRLNPDSSASYYSIYATIKIKQQKSDDALELANKGLKINPQHEDCLQKKAFSLYSLKKLDEAEAVIKDALRHNPENEESFRILGWIALEKKEYRIALEHFRESLRINPLFNSSKEGLICALKHSNMAFRIISASLEEQMRDRKMKYWILLVIYPIFLTAIVITASTSKTGATVVFFGFFLMFPAFLCIRLIINPLSNIMMRFNRYGKYALTKGQIWGANLAVILVILAVIQFVFAGENIYTILSGIGTLVLAVPVSLFFEAASPRHIYKLLGVFSPVLILLMLFVGMSFYDNVFSPGILTVVLLLSFLTGCGSCFIAKKILKN